MSFSSFVAATSLPPRRPPARPGSGTQAREARSPVLPGLGSRTLTSCPCRPERDLSAGWSPRTDGLPVLRAAPGTRYGLGACVTTGRHGRPERAVLLSWRLDAAAWGLWEGLPLRLILWRNLQERELGDAAQGAWGPRTLCTGRCVCSFLDGLCLAADGCSVGLGPCGHVCVSYLQVPLPWSPSVISSSSF